MNPDEQLLVAIIDDTIHTDTPHGHAIKRIVHGLEEFGIRVADVSSPADARAAGRCRRSARGRHGRWRTPPGT